MRLYDATTTCYSTAQISLQIIPLPVQLVNSIDLCDFNNDNTEINVDLSQYDSTIIGTQQNVIVAYYDDPALTNSIASVDINSTATIYVKLSAPDNCITTGSLDLNLISSPTVNDFSIIVCDNFTDGEEVYDLTTHNSDFVTDTAGLSFQYFTEENDALNNINPINDTAYNITDVPQIVYVRITNTSTTCFSIAEMNLDFTFPIVVQDTELNACDDDFNLSEEFDLTTAIPDMLADTTGLNITYYSDEVGAQNADASFLITTPQNHNTASETDIVFVRFYNPLTGCFSIGKIELTVIAIPKLIDGTYNVCDTDFDGQYTLDLSDLNSILIENQTDLIFTYYTNSVEAETETNPIINTSDYPVPASPTAIYIRVVNQSNCWAVALIDISFGESVSVETVTDIMEACDDDLDTFSIFNLTDFESLFTTEIGATFRYYNTQVDANLEQNEIISPTTHQNTTPNTQAVFTRISVLDKCDSIASFNIQTIYITPPTLTETGFCPETSVDLDVGSGYVSHLWNTGETTQIITVDTEGTYSVTLVDSDGCTGTYDVVVTELQLPDSFPANITECDYDGSADGFMLHNLSDHNDQLTGSNPDVTMHYFLSQNDLDSDFNEQSVNFTNTENPQTLFVKVVNNTTNCFSITELTLNTSFVDLSPASIASCDELNSEDGMTPFDLTLATPQVLLNVTESLDVVYYETIEDAETQSNPLDINYTNITPYEQTIYMRAENSDGCVYTEEVLLTVHELPDLYDDDEIIYCLNNYPDTVELEAGNSFNNYTYLWNTNETTSTIQVNQAGEYTVTATNIDGCLKTRTVVVISSNILTIDRIDIVDGTSINTVTVYTSGGGDYEYALDNETGSYQDSNIFANVEGGLHTIYVRDKNDCGIVSEPITVVSVPNFFTPNGDGHNATWIPKGFSTEFQRNIRIYIFDRHGKLLKELQPFGIGWDGTYNGNNLPATDYWYSIEYIEIFSDRHRQLLGHFSLLR